jgi:anti-sigma factor RsiW
MISKISRLAKGVMLKAMPGHITCDEFEAFIAEYFEGELSAVQRQTFDMHLKICEECRAYLKAYRNTIALGRTAYTRGDAPVPGDMPEELVAAILAARTNEA